MLNFIAPVATSALKHLFDALLVLFGVSVMVFLALVLIPGNALDIQLGVDSDRTVTDSYLSSFGIAVSAGTTPILQYFQWLQGILSGNFGVSHVYNAPVLPIVLRALGVTAIIASVAIFISVAVSIPLGLYLGGRGSQLPRTPLILLTNLGIAVPQTLWAILFLYVFSNTVSSFVPGLYVPFSHVFAGDMAAVMYVVAPAIPLALPPAAILTRYTYNAVRQLNTQPFTVALRCRGVSGWRLVKRHTLRNLLVGYTTLSGLMLIDLLAGSVLVEYIFNIPGIGNTLVTGIYKRDTLLVQGVVLYIALTVVVINKSTDALYYTLNPKLRRR